MDYKSCSGVISGCMHVFMVSYILISIVNVILSIRLVAH
jgi:hypothetical protein